MRPYSCYPPARSSFQPIARKFLNPSNPQLRNGGLENHLVSSKPAANILRIDDGFNIQMAIPGLSKEQVKIEINDHQITVSATPSDQENKPKMIRKEFGYEDFKRSFRLQKNANTKAISASFDQGLLTITVPDLEKTTTKINIQ